MPKLFEYLGLIVLFFSNEHEPIHVHGKYHDQESKAELIIENGRVIDIRITRVKGKRPLEPNRLRDFKLVVEHYADEIVKKWIDYFVYHKKIKPEKITRRIK
ncbi:MAG: DUF4160 domain-containing protein [bacterium]